MTRALIPRRKVITLHESSTAFEAARAMCTQEVGCVLVCNERGQPSGMVTDRDLTCALVSRNLSAETTLDQVMTQGVWTIDDKAEVEDIVHSMKEHGVRRVVIVREEEKSGIAKCIGLVSLDDLISARLIKIEDAADIVRSQILHKQHFIQPLRESEITAEPDLKEFIERMEERSGLNRSTTLSLLTILMSSLVRSVHYSSAEKFLAPLPMRLRSRLEDLPAGPDQNLTADFLVGEVVARFNLEPEHAIEVIRQFWDGILTCCGHAEMEKFAEDLPQDLRNLVTPPAVEVSQSREQEPQNPMQMH